MNERVFSISGQASFKFSGRESRWRRVQSDPYFSMVPPSARSATKISGDVSKILCDRRVVVVVDRAKLSVHASK